MSASLPNARGRKLIPAPPGPPGPKGPPSVTPGPAGMTGDAGSYTLYDETLVVEASGLSLDITDQTFDVMIIKARLHVNLNQDTCPNLIITCNGDTSAIYTITATLGGSVVGPTYGMSGMTYPILVPNGVSSQYSNFCTDIRLVFVDYTNSIYCKSMMGIANMVSGSGPVYVFLSGQYNDLVPITNVTLTTSAGLFAVGSSVIVSLQ